MDFASDSRPVEISLLSGRAHYETVVDAVLSATTSVWIATANLKELMVEDHRLRPGKRRGRRAYRSVLAAFGELVQKGVEIRILHASLPSRAFRESFDSLERSARGGIEMRCCPRVHMKVVVIDARLVYIGSANWTGAGLGAKGTGRRNFELGIATEDDGMIDQVQSTFDAIWRGAECAGCRLRDVCEMPLDVFEAST